MLPCSPTAESGAPRTLADSQVGLLLQLMSGSPPGLGAASRWGPVVTDPRGGGALVV